VEVIPAIDLRGGKLVRLEQGDYARETVYDAEPERAAGRFVGQGARRIHVVDLDGARAGETRNEPAIRAIIDAAASVPIQLGGGVRSIERIEQLLELGVDRVILGTLALEQPELLEEAAERFPGRVILGLDARDGLVATRGWLETGELSAEELLDRFAGVPLGGVVYTDIRRDGTLSGPNVEATVRLARATRLPVIASGGISSEQDLVELAETGVIAGSIVGRSLYTGAVDLAAALRAVQSVGHSSEPA
jgi:phosphoribosylformimino-5-aminoimidazole carboxamide ribotide isomerase